MRCDQPSDLDSPTPAEAPPQASETTPLLQRFVSAGHLRYWLLCCWALALAPVVQGHLILIWFAVAMAFAVGRSLMEARLRRAGQMKSLAWLALATASCVVWAAAPLLAWTAPAPAGAVVAVGLLAAGYTLVFTQMKSAPREALIVSAPYGLAATYMAVTFHTEPEAMALIALAPAVAGALVIKLVVTQIRDREIAQAQAEQRGLIADLETARDQADAASVAKSNFLGVMSHELRTPLNGVLGAAQILQADTLRPSQQELVGVIRQSGESLLILLNDILDLTKVEAGKMEMSLTEVDMARFHASLIAPFATMATAKGIAFDAEPPNDAPAVFSSDPLRLQQILNNFLSNALKFTPAGEVALTVRTERVASDKARLTFAVSDNGVGIDAEDLPLLFQPFSQVDASSTRRFSGTGLGLSIARRMAELLGGEVGVASAPGQGSVFHLSLEVEVLAWRTLSEATVEAEPVIEATAMRPLSILVVEDHPVNRAVLSSFLAPLGHGVSLAENGQAGLDQCATQTFDLILMDVNMPVLDGLEATGG